VLSSHPSLLPLAQNQVCVKESELLLTCAGLTAANTFVIVLLETHTLDNPEPLVTVCICLHSLHAHICALSCSFLFEGASPSVNTNLCELKDEHALWCMASAKKLQGLGLTFAI
jgi:hypothetical protein